jgi:DNA-binding CsgD family transcriptional regulator
MAISNESGQQDLTVPQSLLLLGRQRECQALDRLVQAVLAGQSQALILRGEPGVGKSALLDYVVGRASGCHVVRVAGVQSEMELPYAAVHQLCAPMMDRLEQLPAPQRDALAIAFGLQAGPPPSLFLVGLAVLGLLADLAAIRPVLCVVDDAQWLDRSSAQALAFVARRLFAESVACLFAARTDEAPELSGLAVLDVGGLGDADARALLQSVVPGLLDVSVRDRIIGECRGNPLALLELPRGLPPAAIAGGFGLPSTQALPHRLEERFRLRLGPLPADTRLLLLLAAAEPLGDPALVWRAAGRLSIGMGAAAAAVAAGLCEFAPSVRFRHPVVRSAVYQAASPEECRLAHRALADSADADADPDRHAWHRAHAAAGPDEEVAAELERSAIRAQARGGLAAAAAFLQRSTELTPEPARRAERALAAAAAMQGAGAPDAAVGLLGVGLAGPLSELGRARASLLRAEIEFTASRGNAAPPLLLEAARQMEPLDPTSARDTYLQALNAAMFAGRLAVHGGGLAEVSAAVRAAAAPAPATPRIADLLLDTVAVLLSDGAQAAAPAIRRTLDVFRGEGMSAEEELRLMWHACNLAVAQWDDQTWAALAGRYVELARNTGSLAVLPLALSTRIVELLWHGSLTEAAWLATEVDTITVATGLRITNYGALAVAAWQGREAEAKKLIQASVSDAEARGEGIGLTVTGWVSAVLYNGLGQFHAARDAAARASEDPPEPGAVHWAAVELVEAAVRSGDHALATVALDRVVATTQASATDWAQGVEARSRALLSQGRQAEHLHRDALDWLGRGRLRPDLARAHLLYGEWLRRERRRTEARTQLRRAHELFADVSMTAFAERAARELRAAGESASRRDVRTSTDLTPRETQIGHLATQGLSNPEIGSRLFVSPRTVEYHLSNIFAKLGITSRSQLEQVLTGDLLRS